MLNLQNDKPRKIDPIHQYFKRYRLSPDLVELLASKGRVQVKFLSKFSYKIACIWCTVLARRKDKVLIEYISPLLHSIHREWVPQRAVEIIKYASNKK